jgi:hypothetical protein
LAESINASVEFSPTGEIRVVRDARYLSTSERSALLTYGNWTTQDIVSLDLDIEHNDTVGLVQAAGGAYQSASDTVMVVPSTAPGLAQNMPEGTAPLLKQVLTADIDRFDAETELNGRTGHHLAAVNPTDVLSVTHPPGYGSVLIPSRIVWYTHTLASTDNTRGRAYTTSNRWLLHDVSLEHDNATGVTQSNATYHLETSGGAGQAIYPPAYAEEDNALPIMYNWTPYPTFAPELPSVYLPADTTGIAIPPLIGDFSSYASQSAIKADGNTVLFGTANRVYVTRKFIMSNTIGELDITPSTIGANEVIKHAVWGAGYDAYLLTYDTSGDNSYVWYTDNVLSLAAGWTKGAALSGQYEFIRKTATQGALYVIGSRPTTSSGAYSVTWDFTLSNYGFRVRNDIGGSGIATSGRYSLGNGFQCYGTEGSSGSGDLAEISISSPLFPSACTGITDMSIDYNQPYSITLGGSKLSAIKGYTWTSISQSITLPTITGDFTPSPLATGVNTATRTFASSSVWRAGGQMRLRDSALFVGDQFVPAYIRSLTISGNGINGMNRTGQTRYSTNYGATFSAAVDVGTFPGGGFMGGDTSKIGTQIIATKDDQSRKASAGGAYSDYGSAVSQGAIVIPRYEPASTTTDNSGSTPKHVVFASELTSSESMWYWNGASYTAITPTESSIEGLALSPHCIDMWWRNGNYMACIAVYEGSYRLKTSTNGGTSWTDRTALSDLAAYVRYRKGDTTGQQLFFSDGTPYYSSNAGSTKQAKTYPESPTTAPVLFIEPYG